MNEVVSVHENTGKLPEQATSTVPEKKASETYDFSPTILSYKILSDGKGRCCSPYNIHIVCEIENTDPENNQEEKAL